MAAERAFATAASLAHQGRFVSADDVIVALGGVYAAHDGLAGAGNPCLNYLCDIQRRMDAVVWAFVAERPVACLADLEDEIVRSLNVDVVPTLQEAWQNAMGVAQSLNGFHHTNNGPQLHSNYGNQQNFNNQGCNRNGYRNYNHNGSTIDSIQASMSSSSNPRMGVDPNEVDIDEEVEDVEDDDRALKRPTKFDDFGIGPLWMHPMTRARFPVRPHKSVKQDVVLAELSAFEGTLEEFPEHLKKHLRVKWDLVTEAGVLLNTTGLQYVRSHLRAAAKDWIDQAVVEIARDPRYQEQIRRQQQQHNVQIVTSTPQRTFGKVPKLKKPGGNAEAKKFLGKLDAAMEAEDMRYSPSFTKLQNLIEKKIKLSPADTLKIVTEYAFLHVGSSRDRAKRFEQYDQEQDGTADDEEQTNEDTPLAKNASNGDKDADNKNSSSASDSSSEDSDDSSSDEESSSSSSSDESDGEEDHGDNKNNNGGRNFVPKNSKRQHEKDQDKEGNEECNELSAGMHSDISSPKNEDSMKMDILTDENHKNADDCTPKSSSTVAMRPPKRQRVELAMPHLRSDQYIRWIETAELAGLLPSTAALDSRVARQIGRWGEGLVYRYLQSQSSKWKIRWMNEEKESLASYDIILTERDSNAYSTTRFVEVKSTRYGNKNAFEISMNEWDFFTGQGGAHVNYDIYRVFNAGDPYRVRIAVIENPLRLLKEQKINLCLAI